MEEAGEEDWPPISDSQLPPPPPLLEEPQKSLHQATMPKCGNSGAGNSHAGSAANLFDDDDEDDELERLARREMEEDGTDFSPSLPPPPPQRPQPNADQAPHAAATAAAAALLLNGSSRPPSRPPSRPLSSGRNSMGRDSKTSSKGGSPQPTQGVYMTPNIDFTRLDEVSCRGVSPAPSGVSVRSASRSRAAEAAKEKTRVERRDNIIDFIIHDDQPRQGGRSLTPRKSTRNLSRSTSRGPSTARGAARCLYEDPPAKKPATPRDANKAGLRPLTFFEAHPSAPTLPQLTPRSGGGKPPAKQRSQKSIGHPVSGPAQSARAWRSKASAYA